MMFTRLTTAGIMLLEGFEIGSEPHKTIFLIDTHRIMPLPAVLLGSLFLHVIIGWIISRLIETYCYHNYMALPQGTKEPNETVKPPYNEVMVRLGFLSQSFVRQA